MIDSNKAIEKAFSFVQSIDPKYLGAKPENIRLETIQLFGKEWVVVLSYFSSVKGSEDSTANKLLEALKVRRYIKEIEVDSESGEVIAMRNPEAPVTVTASAH